MKSVHKVNLLNLGVPALQAFVAELGEPRYRVQQLLQWIHQKGVTDFDQMLDLSKVFRTKLKAVADIQVPELVQEQVSLDGTHKWLLRLPDQNAIETVFIPEPSRGTLCVSSQVGCTLNCSFCSTGKQGFSRNLSVAEIIGQVWWTIRRFASHPAHKVTNVVMMGMGEPLFNYEAVVPAMDLMMHDHAYGLSKYKVTLSTAGVVPMMQCLSQESKAALAVSLHATNDTLRNQLVPLNKKFPLTVLLEACRQYFPMSAKRSILFEYVMLDGVNDSVAEADQLVRLLSNIRCKINLIPFNPFPHTAYRCSHETTMVQFQQRLMAAGFNVRVRRTRGADIDGACGQLVGQINDRTGRNERWLRNKESPFPPMRKQETPDIIAQS